MAFTQRVPRLAPRSGQKGDRRTVPLDLFRKVLCIGILGVRIGAGLSP